MNYTKHYDMLIERARNRTHPGYTEKHHIIPRCLGGSNKKENIISLSAREHYVAHQLLVKMNPDHHGLIKAANMMACGNTSVRRRNNRLYEWLRIKHSKVMSESQTGASNSQYGTCWVSHITLRLTKNIKNNELQLYLEDGWVKKRIMDFNRYKKSQGQKEARIRTQETTKKNKVSEMIELYNLFSSGNYSSLREFARLNNTYTAQHLSIMWKRHIPEFNPKRWYSYSNTV